MPGAVPWDSGVGSASITLPEGVTVGAVVAVNAVGDVYHPETGEVLKRAEALKQTEVLKRVEVQKRVEVPKRAEVPKQTEVLKRVQAN